LRISLVSEHRSAYLQLAGFVIVALTMIEMFTISRSSFVPASFVSTISMLAVTFLMGRFGDAIRGLSPIKVAIGVGNAVVLYLLFLGGNDFLKEYSPFGISVSNEGGIYSLFAGTSTPLLLLVLIFDAVGFESYFRGNLQRLLQSKLGLGAVFLVAALDASIHLSSLNPLFPATTFIADSVWGLNYYYTKDMYSNIASHLVWDILVFIVIPIR
jgi:membrane protease YdiL (CAAX protease family)